MGTKTKGTKEWGSSLNIAKGCSHNCGYCYARAAAHRYGWKRGAWQDMELIRETVRIKFRKRKYQPIMFPTSHDLTPAILEPARIVLGNLLRAGNDVLVVSKPHREVMAVLREAAAKHKNQIEFRFTITTFDEALAKKYEPGAPSINERLLTLMDTRQEGFKASVSVEPFLSDPVQTVIKLYALVDSIWVGPMNNVPLATTPELKSLYSPPYLRQVFRRLVAMDHGYGKIKFKDAFLYRMDR